MEPKNMKIAGAGTVGAGEYANISCSGSAKILGDIKCQSFSVAGSAASEGDIHCEETCKTAGAFKTKGAIHAHTISCAGAVKIKKDARANLIKIAGAASVGGDCTAEKAKIAGAIAVGGLLNAETIEIRLSGGNGNCEIGSIGGGSLKVERGQRNGLFGFRKKCKAKLYTDLIEADSAKLENTHAKTVRVIDAEIGEGCEIDTLEYSGSAAVHKKSTVKNLIKTTD